MKLWRKLNKILKKISKKFLFNPPKLKLNKKFLDKQKVNYFPIFNPFFTQPSNNDKVKKELSKAKN